VCAETYQLYRDYDRDQLNKKAKKYVKNDKEHVEEIWQYLSTLSYTEELNVIRVE